MGSGCATEAQDREAVKHVEEDADEQVVVARARELRAEGKSLRAVGRALIEEGHRPRRGVKWHVQVLARVTGNINVRC